MINLYEAKYEKKKSRKEKEIIRNRRFLATGEEPGEDLTDFVRSMSPDEVTDMRRNSHENERGQKNFPAVGNRPTKMSNALLARRDDGMLQNLRRAIINRRLASGRYYARGKRDNEAENSIRRVRRESIDSLLNYIIEARRKKRQLRILHTAHYTSPSTRNDILQHGLRPGTRSDGAYHDKGMSVLYTTPSPGVGADYGTAAVHFKVMNPRVTRIDSPKTYGARLKDWMRNSSDDDLVSNKNRPQTSYDQARNAIRSGAKVIRVPDAHGAPYEEMPKERRGDYVILDKDVANRSIDRNPRPVIRGYKPKVRRNMNESTHHI
jgi:hypothetical protein